MGREGRRVRSLAIDEYLFNASREGFHKAQYFIFFFYTQMGLVARYLLGHSEVKLED